MDQVCHCRGIWHPSLPSWNSTLYLLCTCTFHKYILTNSEEHIAQYYFIFKDYKSKFFYWEILELVRKVVLTSIIVYIGPGTPSQFIVAMIIAFAAIVVHLEVNPFQLPVDNRLHSVNLISVLLTVFYGLLQLANFGEQYSSLAITSLMIALHVAVILSHVLFFLLILQKKAKKVSGVLAKLKSKIFGRSRVSPGASEQLHEPELHNAVELQST